MKTTYLEKVMDGKTLKVLHWHVIAYVHLIVSDKAFKRPPGITLVLHQVGMTLGLLWKMSSIRSFGCKRRKVLRLDGWNGLDGNQVYCWVVQVYHHGREFWNLGKRVLPNFYFLEPWRLGRSPRSTELDMPFLLQEEFKKKTLRPAKR